MSLEQEIICILAKKDVEKAIDYVKKGNLTIKINNINIQSIYENPDSDGEIYIQFSVILILNQIVSVVVCPLCYITKDGYYSLYDNFKNELDNLIVSLDEINEYIKRDK